MRHASVEPARLEVSAADVLAWRHRLEALLTRDDLSEEDVLHTMEELMLWCEALYLEGRRCRP